MNPVFEALQIDLNEAEVEIATLAAEVTDRESRLAQLQAVIDEAPEVEAQLAQLNREYGVVRDQYQKLIQTREIQNLSEKASDTEQVAFRVLNPPMAGTEPAYPPRLLFLAAALMVAVAAGGVVCLLLARLKPVFGTGSELRQISGVPLLGVIGQATSSPSAPSRIKASVAWFLSAASALIKENKTTPQQRGVPHTARVGPSPRRSVAVANDEQPRNGVDMLLDRLSADELIASVPEEQRKLAEQYRVIKRPILRNADPNRDSRVMPGNLLMVASALPGEGKTFTSINLAVSIAKERDWSVLLVDSDCHKRHLSRVLGAEQARGLPTYYGSPGSPSIL